MENYIPTPDSQAILSRIQELCSINPKIWKDITDTGVFRDCMSYKDYLTALVNYYRQNKEAKDLAAKAKLIEAESKPRFKNADIRDKLDQATLAEKIQKINLDRTKQEQLLIQVLASRLEYISKQEIQNLLQISFTNMCNILRHTADEEPTMQVAVDRCLSELYNLATELETQALLDKQNYISTKLNAEFCAEDITDTFNFSSENES